MIAPPVAWGVAARPKPGETESGDRWLVKTLPDGALLAAADGLGHGHEAAVVADLAMRTVEAHAEMPLNEIVQRCHESLLRTRGVALSLARWDAVRRSVAWIGVGNVEGLLLRTGPAARTLSERLLLRVGVVGVRLPWLAVSSVGVSGPALLVFVTDGIATGFERGLDPRVQAQQAAEETLARHFKGTDDGLVVMARFEG